MCGLAVWSVLSFSSPFLHSVVPAQFIASHTPTDFPIGMGCVGSPHSECVLSITIRTISLMSFYINSVIMPISKAITIENPNNNHIFSFSLIISILLAFRRWLVTPMWFTGNARNTFNVFVYVPPDNIPIICRTLFYFTLTIFTFVRRHHFTPS